MSVMKTLLGMVAAALVSFEAVPAWAQLWPAGPIRIVVGDEPGGSADISARIVGEFLSQASGQPVTIENMPGAEGSLALDAVARATPDGQTILVGPAESLYRRVLDNKTPFEAGSTLAPITILTSQPLVIVVNSWTGLQSFAALIAAARAHPDGMSYATPSSAGTSVIVGALMFRRAGVKARNVPYRDGARAAQYLARGIMPAGVIGQGPITSYAERGRLTILAVTSPERAKSLPDVPTMVELGYPEIAITQWFTAFAPAGTPGEIVERLAAACAAVLADPTVRERLAAAALETVGGTPADVSGRLAAEGEAWLRRARELGLDRN